LEQENEILRRAAAYFARENVNALPIRQRVFVESDSALVDCQSV
jgi:hypothetical protein